MSDAGSAPKMEGVDRLWAGLRAHDPDPASAPADNHLWVEEAAEHGFVDSRGVKLHYAALGTGPLIVMLHGFPDCWLTWRHQMGALADRFRCVAIDMRGYNLSDKPPAREDYDMTRLCGDVVAVMKHFGETPAIVCAHDWGGAVAWRLAIASPDKVSRLIILNLPHPSGMTREMANNPRQVEAGQYARDFMQEGAESGLTAERLASWVREPEVRAKYVEAFKRSSFAGMLHYYRMNYIREPYRELTGFPKVRCPVLMLHGLNDPALLPETTDGTWKWIEKDLTFVSVPGAGHFVQQDAPEMVSRTMRMWLNRDA